MKVGRVFKGLLTLGAVCAMVGLPGQTWAGSIKIGSVSDEPAQEIKKFQPLANYLAKKLKPEGVNEGRVIVTRTLAEMATLLREGGVDVYIDSPFPSVAVSRQSGSQPVLRRWKKGVAEYHSVIFARQDGGLSRLEDLKGKVIGFEEPFSSSGYFLPKMILVQQRLKPVLKQSVSAPVLAGEIGYVFTRDDENTVEWVLRKRVAAGAVDDQSFQRLAKTNLDTLKVIHWTFSLPRHVVSYRPGLSPALAGRITEILLKMDQSEDGRKTLQEFERTTKFDALPPHALTPLLKFGSFIDAEVRRQ
jgi:phosphonate transport system substrate-binding protein